MKRHAAPTIAAMLLLLPVLYVASYLLLLERYSPGDGSVAASYRIGGKFAWTLYWPLEQMDRRLRSGWDIGLKKQGGGLVILQSDETKSGN